MFLQLRVPLHFLVAILVSSDFLANFQLPEEGQLFDKVQYVEMAKEAASKLIDEYRKDAQSKLPPPEKRFNRSGGYFGELSNFYEFNIHRNNPVLFL